jgi:cytochrome P450
MDRTWGRGALFGSDGGLDELTEASTHLKNILSALIILVLHLTSRLANLVTVVGHRCIQDVKIGDHILSKDTTILSNLYRMHTNKDIWPNPNQFDPDNFVDEEGKTIRREYLVPFALGR